MRMSGQRFEGTQHRTRISATIAVRRQHTGSSAMRDALTIAISETYQGMRHEHWHGKSFRQFWEWFNARCIDIVGAADADELDALEAALLEVRSAVEEGGYMVPSDRLDEIIAPPM
jgi:hypothetical protein